MIDNDNIVIAWSSNVRSITLWSLDSSQGDTGPSLFSMLLRNFIASHILDGTRLYAVGDIHGRADLLRRVHEFIRQDACCSEASRKVVMYLGDYVDRGRDPCGVIDMLINDPLPGLERIHLKGNHDDCLIRFLANPQLGRLWLSHGGDSTVRSYGVLPPRSLSRSEIHRVHRELLRALPWAHSAFLRDLRLSHSEGGYFFVHAGIRPGTPFDRQTELDMLWIGKTFLNSRSNHGQIIVHGHNVTQVPDVQLNRIGIDTGAYQSGQLTCLILQSTQRYFWQTSRPERDRPLRVSPVRMERVPGLPVGGLLEVSQGNGLSTNPR